MQAPGQEGRDGTIVPSPQMAARIIPITAPGPVMADPERSSRRAGAVMTSMMMPTIRDTSAHHQYSLRLARPEKVAYFLKNRWTACLIVAP